MRVLGIVALAVAAAGESCPMGFGALKPSGGSMKTLPGMKGLEETNKYVEELMKIDFEAVKADIIEAMTDSKEFWPADYGHYGPLFVRLGWHCAGSYRNSDGRGGCDGGRQNFDPERSWDDNTNLDKARRVLWPIKQKYGVGLSYGDLYILAATAAIEAMGGPVLGFCAGRVDDVSGAQSIVLGPSDVHDELFPCEEEGNCQRPQGSVATGLIYVNPQGPGGFPDPAASAESVRDVFARMSMNDRETVALVGGGHAFGKTHGACPDGPGPRPSEDQENAWPGNCGTGKRDDQFTSGFEGPWTHTPIEWSNFYFKYLHQNTFGKTVSPAGNIQWKIIGGPEVPKAPGAFGGEQEIMMLTADVAFQHDPMGIHQTIVEEYANDIESLNKDFAAAWYKLVTRDMGPVTRCVGDMTPPAQPFQAPLPGPPAEGEMGWNMMDVKDMLMDDPVIKENAPLLIRLAFACAQTFRQTDYSGGCNGARIRQMPEASFELNKGLDAALTLLEGIQNSHDGLSLSDLIVLAGNSAIELLGGPEMIFCGGRADSAEDEQLTEREFLEPKVNGRTDNEAKLLNYQGDLWGLTSEELVALIGGGHSVGEKHADVSGFDGAWTMNPTEFDNSLFETLFMYDWVKQTSRGGNEMYVNTCPPGTEFTEDCPRLTILETDYMLRYDSLLFPSALKFASDNDYFLSVFRTAWTKMMNADRFSGPNGNLCDERHDLLLIPASLQEELGKAHEEMMEEIVVEMEEMEAMAPTNTVDLDLIRQALEDAKESQNRFFSTLLGRSVGTTTTQMTVFGAVDAVARVSGYVAMASALVYIVATFAMKKPEDELLSEETPILRAA